jgi:hypothetical protein
MKRTIPLVSLFCLFGICGAHAVESTVTVCAASLEPNARLVFNAVSARPQPTVMLRSVLAARVRELVFTDRLPMNAARPAAEAASQCLRIARHCIGDVC